MTIHTSVDKITYKEYRKAMRSVNTKRCLAAVIAAELISVFISVLGSKQIWILAALPIAALAVSLCVFSLKNKKAYAEEYCGGRLHTYLFGDSKYAVSDGKTVRTEEWKKVNHIEVDAKYLYIYGKSSKVDIIPRRCLKKGECELITNMYNIAIKNRAK